MSFLDRLFKKKTSAGLPRPSRVYVFARGFQPSEEQVYQALAGLLELHKGVLTSAHLAGVPVEAAAVPAPIREVFLNVVPVMVKSKHPNAYTVDALRLDQQTGRDMAAIAVWDGPAAEAARQRLAKK